MNFGIKFYEAFEIGGVPFWFTETIFNTWIIMAILIIFALIVRSKLNSFKETPTGLQNFVELIVETMDSFTKANMGEEQAYFGNWFFGLFCLILLSNLAGLFGFRPPTADISTTAAFGISTFFLIHFMGITKGKAEYFKDYFRPIPILFPINLIGEIATPISLSFRLFGNLLAGVIIMGMIYALFPIFLKIGVPAVLHVYFDVFSGCLQSFIFVILSMTFIKGKIPS